MKIAYIDASNLHFGIKQNDWDLDYRSFRSWLRDKYAVDKAILFMGLLPDKSKLYNSFQSMGYDICFRPTIVQKNGDIKGNVDGELILAIARGFYENSLDEAVLVSGDGDYYCIVEFLKEKKVPIKIISPNKKYLSFLLRKSNVPIVILDDFKHKLGTKKKPPDRP
jgi:uncharacterized LabA/DUF88 family protein